jgi:uncharacterized protein (TIGR02594 family)
MGAQFIKNNTTILQNQGIANPTPGQLYIMHFLGTAGGPKMIKAAQTDPNADATAMFPGPAAANSSIFQGKTVGQVYQNMASKADSKANAYANQQGQPSPCERPGAKPATADGKATSGPPGKATSGPDGTTKATAGPNAATATGALGAATNQAGKNRNEINTFLRSNGETLDATTNNWCAAFTNASLSAAGIKGNGSNVATSFLTWGQPIDGAPAEGDVLVQPRGHSAGTTGGHVGLATGETRVDDNGVTQYKMLSGNATGTGKVSYTWENASSLSVRRASTSSI